VTDDEKLPLEEDDGAEGEEKAQVDPFSEYINDNLSLSDVPEDGKGQTPADDLASSTRPKGGSGPLSAPKGFFEADKDDDLDDEDENPFMPRPPFGSGAPRPPGSSPFGSSRFGTGLPRPLGSSDSKDEGLRPGSSSPLGSRFGPPSGAPGSGAGPGHPFGGSRFGGSSTPPPSSSNFGSRFGSGSTPPNRPEPSRFGTFDKPLDNLRKSSWRVLQDDLGELLDKEARVIIGVLMALVILLLNLLYIDNLRLTIATQEGRITELRQQLEQTRERLEGLGRE